MLDDDSWTPGYNPDFLAHVYAKRRAERRFPKGPPKKAKLEPKYGQPKHYLAHVTDWLRHKMFVEEQIIWAERGRAVSEIIQEVGEKHGVTKGEIIGDRRSRYIVAARHEAMARVYKARPDLSLPMIGRLFGGRDHTTVIHAARKMGVHESRKPWVQGGRETE